MGRSRSRLSGFQPMKLSCRPPSLVLLVPLLLASGLPRCCFALSEIADVSRERARELGIAVTSTTRTDDVRVQVEFKTAGALKEFRWSDLEVTHGGKRLVLAALMPQRPKPDSVRLEFYLDPAALPDSTVTIFVYDAPLGGTGYRLKMKDYPAQPPPR